MEPPPVRVLPRMGFSIQVGAFSNGQNAIRLTQTLERNGISAYYFRHSSGLFRVRFGDFPSAEEARAKAEALVAARIIDVYLVIRPEDYAMARVKALGIEGVRNELVTTAESFVGIQYQWGGQTPERGFDCSGLAMAVYQLNGLDLPRTSIEQYQMGTPISRADLGKGDLIFFTIKGGSKVSHVGLYAGEDRFIHAPGGGKKIRSDSLTHAYYSSRYIGARTYL